MFNEIDTDTIAEALHQITAPRRVPFRYQVRPEELIAALDALGIIGLARDERADLTAAPKAG